MRLAVIAVLLLLSVGCAHAPGWTVEWLDESEAEVSACLVNVPRRHLKCVDEETFLLRLKELEAQ